MTEQHHSPRGRKLTLRARAERQQQTRQRIIDATVQLHQEIGPLRTTVTAIAQRAGVERLTVYRHFADEQALHVACQQRFFSVNPPPDPAAWTALQEFGPRVRTALRELYAYWEGIEEMAGALLRDHQIEPERAGRGIVAFTGRCREAILDRNGGRGTQALLRKAVVGHAVQFSTWRSLVREGGLTNEQAAAVMTEMVTTR